MKSSTPSRICDIALKSALGAEEVWAREVAKTGPAEVIVALPRSWLGPGDYQLRLLGLDEENRGILVSVVSSRSRSKVYVFLFTSRFRHVTHCNYSLKKFAISFLKSSKCAPLVDLVLQFLLEEL